MLCSLLSYSRPAYLVSDTTTQHPHYTAQDSKSLTLAVSRRATRDALEGETALGAVGSSAWLGVPSGKPFL